MRTGGGCEKARVGARDEATTAEMGGSVVPDAVGGRLPDPVPGRLRVDEGWSVMLGRLKLNEVEAGARKDWPGCWVLCSMRGGT
jgi:hypothetical protein